MIGQHRHSTIATLLILLAVPAAAVAGQPGDADRADRAARLKQAAALQAKAKQLRAAENLPALADTLMSLGDVYVALGDFSAARARYVEALPILRAKLSKDDLRLANLLWNIALMHDRLSQYAAVRTHGEEALAICRRTLAKDDPRTGVILNRLGVASFKLGELPAARKYHEEALALRRSKLGNDDPQVADSLSDLGNVLWKLGDLVAAAKHHTEALDIRRRKLAKDDLRIADSLTNLGLVCHGQGELAAARTHNEESLAIYSRKLPKDDLRVATGHCSLGFVCWELSDLPAARMHYEEGLAIFRRTLPNDDFTILQHLSMLGDVRRRMGDFTAARQLHEQVLASLRRKLPCDDPRIADSLCSLGLALYGLMDLPAAHKCYDEAVTIYRCTLTNDDVRIACGLTGLGNVLWSLGDSRAARKLHEQALALRRHKLPKDDPHIAESLTNLGLVLHDLDELAASRTHHAEALAIYRRKLTKNDPRIATTLNNLGGALHALNDLAAAREHFEAALAIYRRTLPKDDIRIANSLDNLGTVVHGLDLEASRKYHEEALLILRRKLPSDDPRIAGTLNALSIVLCDLRDLPAARKLAEEALTICRRKRGNDHPGIARSLNNLGNVLAAMGNVAVARKCYLDALAISRSGLPKDHPLVCVSLNGLVRLEHRDHHDAKALAYLEEVTNLRLARQDRDGLARSEREQLSAAARWRPLVDVMLQGHLRAQRFVQAYNLTIAAKGAVTARQRWLRWQRDVTDKRVSQLLNELRAVDSQLVQIGLSGTRQQPRPTTDLDARLQQLTRRRDEVERGLIAVSPAFKLERERGCRGHEQVAAALPPEAVLVDFVEYLPVNLDWLTGDEKTTPPPRLGAFVVRRGLALHWVDLGASKDMATLVDRWRSSYGVPLKSAKEPSAGAELRKRLWQPIEPHVAGAKLILVAPDGPLNRLPLAALPGKQAGSYLLEEYAFVNIPVPQLLPDLLAKTEPRFERPASMVLVGDVDFGAPGEPFRPLTGTRTEINDIRDTFEQHFADGKLTVLRRDKATKQAFVTAVRDGRYMHLATHGAFADPSVQSVFAPEQRARALRTALAFDRQVVGEHPALLSGIVFAGANRKDKRDEAILTALEVGELELRGVELVVLSACDTGLGRVAGGEGVLGLQRAFQVAGARTTVTSLWKVSDRETQRLMSRFYENLWEKKLTKAEALRDAQLWMMREGNTRGLDLPPDPKTLPPQYWAAFVLSGDWR